MDRTTLQAIKLVLTTPLDIYESTIADIERGIIQADDPQTIERLKSLSREYSQKIDQARDQFLEATLAGSRPVSESGVSFFLKVKEIAEEYAKLLESLEYKVDKVVVEQELNLLRKQMQEDPETHAMFEPIVQIMEEEMEKMYKKGN